jgi:hypothetical protein
MALGSVGQELGPLHWKLRGGTRWRSDLNGTPSLGREGLDLDYHHRPGMGNERQRVVPGMISVQESRLVVGYCRGQKEQRASE